jgi:hypothetical protein
VIKLLTLVSLVALGSAGAQVTGPRPRPTPPRNPTDSVRPGDSTKVDSAQAKTLIKWEEADSVTQALLAKKGYDVTRYQGVKVTFNAKQRTLYLEGSPAGVGRGETLLIGDTITYNDSTKVVLARGDTLVLRDPSRGSADVIAEGTLRYNVESRRGSVTNISTSVESGEKWYVFGAAAGFVNDTTGGRSTRFYAKNGSITSCDDSIPDYHFQSKEIKLISRGPPCFTSATFPCSGCHSFSRTCARGGEVACSPRGSESTRYSATVHRIEDISRTSAITSHSAITWMPR